MSLIQSVDGTATVDSYDKGDKLPVRDFTHIIAALADFPDYDAAVDNFIPVVRPDWVSASVQKNKLANPRQYSPDPRLFLSGVVVCCSDLPEGDKDAIVGGVLAMGGLHSSRVASLVTHIVALTMDSKDCQAVADKGLKIKVVLPHWYASYVSKISGRADEF